MPQQDYLRLVELMRDNPLARGHIRLNSFELDRGYARPFAKLCDTRTVLYEDFDLSFVEEGVCIDVFPLVPVSDDAAERVAMRKRWRKDFVMLGLSKGHLVPHESIVKTLGKAVLKPFAMLRGYAAFVADVCADVDDVRHGFGDVEYVLSVEETVTQLESRWFSETVYLPFEHMLLPAPGCWDEILTVLYGDYMTPPPESERHAHRSEAYWKPGFGG